MPAPQCRRTRLVLNLALPFLLVGLDMLGRTYRAGTASFGNQAKFSPRSQVVRRDSSEFVGAELEEFRPAFTALEILARAALHRTSSPLQFRLSNALVKTPI